MNSPWGCLEKVPGFSAVTAEWKRHAGADFDALKTGFLQRAGRTASSYPCPHKLGCSHQVHPRGTGFVGVCKEDDGTGCDDLVLTKEAVEVWELNRATLCRALGDSLGCDARGEPSGVAGVWEVGMVKGTTVPVLLCLLAKRDEFRAAVAELTGRVRGRYLLVAPTSGFMDLGCRELLANVGAEFFDMAAHLVLTENGALKASESALATVGRMRGTASGGAGVAADEIVSRGKLRYRTGFEDVWLGDTHYDLRGRTKARLCLQFMVEQNAFDAKSACHLVDKIDVFVRERGNFPRAADIKIDHYFNDPHDPEKRLPSLRKDLIVAAGRNGRYFLKTD